VVPNVGFVVLFGRCKGRRPSNSVSPVRFECFAFLSRFLTRCSTGGSNCSVMQGSTTPADVVVGAERDAHSIFGYWVAMRREDAQAGGVGPIGQLFSLPLSGRFD
jgi:hypothetical protein